MIINYLKIAYRNIFRNKGYSLINIIGLAIGIACCLMILLYVTDEIAYDRHNEKGENIYRIILDAKLGTQEIIGPSTPAPMAFTLVEEFPEVIQATRLFKPERFLIRYKENLFNEDLFVYADSTVFDVFTIPMLKGDPATALVQPHTIVLTENISEKYFGNENPMGKKLTMEDGTDYVVTGIVKDQPRQSHFQFDFLASLISTDDFANNTRWVDNSFQTYIVLAEGALHKLTNAKFNDLMKKYAGPQIQMALGINMQTFIDAGNRYTYYLEPLYDIYLHSDLSNDLGDKGNITYVYIFSVIAVFILFIACINFMNLATARSASRAREVGIRKVVGSIKSQLIFQFLSESIMLTLIATSLAVIIVTILLPYFNNLIGKELVFNLIEDLKMLPALIILTLFVGILAGSYPAFFLATFQPVKVLYGNLAKSARGGKFRSLLVVFQFSVTIFLFVGTIIVQKQLNYFNNKDLGFIKEQLLIIPRADVFEDQHEAFKQELLKNPNIIMASYSSTIPGKNFSFSATKRGDLPGEEIIAPGILNSDADFFTTYQLNMASGRYFSEEMPNESASIILNEAAVISYGFKDSPLGMEMIRVTGNPDTDRRYNIIGVVKDINFQSLHEKVEPMVIFYNPDITNYLSLKISENNIQETIAYIEDKWKEFVPNKILEYYFFDDDYEQLYLAENRTGKIFSVFSALAIFIACLGLLGLSSYTAEQRSKEIGIRKVLGASVQSIINLLSKETIALVGISSVLAWPAAYYLMRNWLQDFENQINIGVGEFILSTTVALFLGLMIVGFQAYKAAVSNPVEALKYE